MLYRILYKESGLFQFILAVLGSLIGMTLLLSSVQFYIEINRILNNNEDLLSPDYLIINKSVTAMNTAGLRKAVFNKSEIEEIKKQRFTKSVAPFVSNGFEVKAFTDAGGKIPPIYTDMFFESLPDEFLDVDKSNWKYQTGDTLLPIVVPRDYLNLYNFGYALSKGMPQISGNMISMLRFTLRLNGAIKSKVIYGRIVGFTDRINTILVPYNFLIETNKELSGEELPEPSRILIEAKDPSDKTIPKFLEDRDYETNKEKLKNSKLNILLNIMMSILSGLSLTIIALSFLVFTLAFQLLITKKKEKIQTLLYLGYSTFYISKYYIGLFVLMIILISIGSIIAVNYLTLILKSMLNEYNFLILGELNKEVYIVCSLISLIIFIVNSIFLNVQTSRLINK